MMYVTLRRHRLDASKTRSLQTPGEDDMGFKGPVAQFVDGGKDHPDLKSNAGLRWCNLHRATLMHQGAETLKE